MLAMRKASSYLYTGCFLRLIVRLRSLTEAFVCPVLQRLLIAKEFGDKSAERRAHCNLGNSHIFLNQFEVAAGHYK